MVQFLFRMGEISEAAKNRGNALKNAYLLEQFLFDVNVQLSWIDEQQRQIGIAERGANLTTAQRHLNRHEVII